MLKTWQKKFQVHFNNLTTKSYGNFANREICSFIGLQWCLPGNFAQGSRKNSTRAKFSRIRALVSNWHTERIMGSYKKHIFGGGGGRRRGGDLINSQLETLDSLSTAVYSVNINLQKIRRRKINKQTKSSTRVSRLGKSIWQKFHQPCFASKFSQTFIPRNAL